MMVFLAADELLDEVGRFIADARSAEYEFIGTDSSFGFTLKKEPGGMVAVRDRRDRGNLIDVISVQELIEAIWTAVDTFVAKNGPYLVDPNNPVAGDLAYVMKKFKEAFNIA
jgi:hypothetical protein